MRIYFLFFLKDLKYTYIYLHMCVCLQLFHLRKICNSYICLCVKVLFKFCQWGGWFMRTQVHLVLIRTRYKLFFVKLFSSWVLVVLMYSYLCIYFFFVFLIYVYFRLFFCFYVLFELELPCSFNLFLLLISYTFEVVLK